MVADREPKRVRSEYVTLPELKLLQRIRGLTDGVFLCIIVKEDDQPSSLILVSDGKKLEKLDG